MANPRKPIWDSQESTGKRSAIFRRTTHVGHVMDGVNLSIYLNPNHTYGAVAWKNSPIMGRSGTVRAVSFEDAARAFYDLIDQLETLDLGPDGDARRDVTHRR